MNGIPGLIFASKAPDYLLAPHIQAAGIDWAALGAWILPILIDLITYLILGSLLLWWKPKQLTRWSDTVKRVPFKSFGIGLVLVFSGYLMAILGLLLVLAIALFLFFIRFNDLGGIVLGLGLPAFGLFLGGLYLFIAFISKLVVVFLIGKLLFGRFYPKALAHNFWPLLLGLVIYLILAAIPWIGWVVGVITALVGFGAIWLSLQEKTPAEASLPDDASLPTETLLPVEAPLPAETLKINPEPGE